MPDKNWAVVPNHCSESCHLFSMRNIERDVKAILRKLLLEWQVTGRKWGHGLDDFKLEIIGRQAELGARFCIFVAGIILPI
jgi:hypothetical protein